MHLPPVRIFVTCDRCQRRYSATPNQQLRVWICQDCRKQESIERQRLRSSWVPGDYRMIHDPTESWSPTTGGTWLDRTSVLREMAHGNLEPGTRFDCRGTLYVVTSDYRLIKIQGNNENANTEVTWNTGTNAHHAGQSTD